MAVSNFAFTDTGIITGYDPVKHLVTVQIHPATANDPALKTGWIPLASMWVGNGWGMFAAPSLGDICVVIYQTGDRQRPIGATLIFTRKNGLLPTVPSQEFWLVHKSGSFVKLTNDGAISISANTAVNVTAPEVNIDSLEVNVGNIGGTLEKLLMDTARTVFNTHTHQSGAIPPPDQQMTSSVATTHTKAN